MGPDFGYFANSSKSWLVVKEQHLAEAERVFAETGLRITCEGKRHLGAALGTRDFVVDYVQEKVANWKAEIGHLSSFAKSEPHAAYAALTHGLMSHWMFSLRSIEGIAHLMQPVEDAIRLQLLPAITGVRGIRAPPQMGIPGPHNSSDMGTEGPEISSVIGTRRPRNSGDMGIL